MTEDKGWGKIMLGVRLEKMVEACFFRGWTQIVTADLRPGDHWEMTEGMVPTSAANTLVRTLLKSDCESLLMIDSDGDFPEHLVTEMRELESGKEFDCLQAFYTRRGWPPEAIWFQRDKFGTLHNCILLGETTEPVALIGTHCVLIRRKVFETLLGKDDPETHDWFFYPRGKRMTEDTAFSQEAYEAGFKLGATTAIKTNHVAHLSVGWDAYQEYLHTSGQVEQLERFDELTQLMVKFTGESKENIVHKMTKGNVNVKDAWEKENPTGAVEVRKFYGDKSYLYDLLNWNCSLNYIGITRPLYNYSGKKVLVVGAGLGTEAKILSMANDVDVYELPGVLRDFCHSRLNGSVQYLEGKTFPEAIFTSEIPEFGYDLVVAIDTIEHIHPDEFVETMDAIGMVIRPGGELYAHNNFGEQEKYPMHFDNEKVFTDWAAKSGLIQTSERVWTKGETK
jgi:2-polyprenyl-3-methyl-5-hydroxy-6-metoxy-1,4-benzoquinol methylase